MLPAILSVGVTSRADSNFADGGRNNYLRRL